MTETGSALRFLDRIAKAETLDELARIRDDVKGAGLSTVADQRVTEALRSRGDVLAGRNAERATAFRKGAQLLEPGSTGTTSADPEPSRAKELPLPIRAQSPAARTDPPTSIVPGLPDPGLPRSTGELVVPVVSPALARAAWDAYVAIAQALEDPADVVEIKGKRFRRKSFWRKIANAYGIDVELREASQELKDDAQGPYWSSHVVVRATTRFGRHADGVASCSNREPDKAGATAHVVYATAYTRAANRAIADLVAAGEVSAEEVE